ncbi:MAG: ABC transporter ATP-binding protein [Anaerolineae bacterium]|nr:ABC transporter ATP-binding protein [Anaerolineae bacterium]MCX8068543.1 ABC transporter ATP-binding protein [Anaerolineae bacterium]MDW7991797.1 ABC transporter ATP-binding protein [Anaerolineae bacterium]
MPLLEGKGVTRYFGGLAAVHKVDFYVERGEIVGLIGPNGAGKTTLFNLISGALVPQSGQIHFKGENITGLKPHVICKKGIARTFQLVRIFPNMSALENVALAALFGRPDGLSMKQALEEAEKWLEFVGLSAVKGVPARNLTLANQKRLEVARALATDPELLLLDELMAGLNPTEVAQAMDLVNQIRERGITVFVVEHVMKAIMGICDRIIVLHHGEKIAEGTPQEIANSRTVIEVYLGE